MKFIISGKNIDVTPGLRTAVEDKLGKLEKYFTAETEVHVTLGVEKDRQKIEVTIPVKGNIIRSEQTSNDMYVSIDLVEEIIERQLKKYKNKIIDKKQTAGNFKQEFIDKDYVDDEEIQIVRSKKFDIKPMYPEDACIQMELLGHNFFVFCNAETDQVNVVYKRKGNTYGIMEPELQGNYSPVCVLGSFYENKEKALLSLAEILLNINKNIEKIISLCQNKITGKQPKFYRNWGPLRCRFS